MFELKQIDNIHDLVQQLDHISDKNYLTHNIHPYPAKFIPQIPAAIIQSYSNRRDVILDPFCGSGTTLLEAIIRDRRAVGLDSNPIGVLVSRAKTTVLTNAEASLVEASVNEVAETAAKIRADANWLSSVIKKDTIPLFPNIDHWFKPQVQIELTFLKKLISENQFSQQIHNFLNASLSAIVVKVSNQDSDTRWVARPKQIGNGETIRAYIRKVLDNLRKNRELGAVLRGKNIHATVIADDVNSILNYVPGESVDLIVTSPPYLNSFDYYLYHKLRMFWLGYDHKKVQALEIGSRNKHSDHGLEGSVFIAQMKSAFSDLHQTLKRRGYCAAVIGDSELRAELVRMDKAYLEMMDGIGFELVNKVSFDQRKYTRSFTPNLKKKPKQSHIIIWRKKT